MHGVTSNMDAQAFILLKRLQHMQTMLELAGFRSGKWLEADTLFERVYPYLVQNKDKIKAIFPNRMCKTFDKFTGEKSDRRLVTSWLRKICKMYNIDFISKWEHRRNKDNFNKCESVYKYLVVV